LIERKQPVPLESYGWINSGCNRQDLILCSLQSMFVGSIERLM